MSYLQSAERLTVTVLKARSLPNVGHEQKKAGDAPGKCPLVTESSIFQNGRQHLNATFLFAFLETIT